jgi:hypothetical protein
MNCFEQPWVQRAVYGYGGKNQKEKKKFKRAEEKQREGEAEEDVFFFFWKDITRKILDNVQGKKKKK